VKVSKLLLLSFLFACVGITVEIFFTAFYGVAKSLTAGEPINWSLTGKTYVWMFFIYASIPFFAKTILSKLDHLHLFLKAAIGVVIIFIVEFIAGWLLEIITGKCPWEYTEGWHIMGYIRLDYAFFWYIFALGVILLYQTLEKRL
jgi:hypothetical protein